MKTERNMLLPSFPFRKFSCASERRPVFLDKQGREDTLDTAEQTDGKMDSGQKPDKLGWLRQNTQQLVEQLPKLEASWLQSIRFVFRPDAKQQALIDQRVQDEAERRVADEIRSADGKIKTVLRRSERAYLVTEAKKQILEDMRRYLEQQQEKMREKQEKYGKWRQYLGLSPDAVALSELEASERLRGNVTDVQARTEQETQSAAVEEKFATAREGEMMLRDQLTEMGIVSPEEFDKLLTEHLKGADSLLNRITSAPELKGNKVLLKALIRTAKELRHKRVRGYRAMRAANEDADVGTIEQRLDRLKRTVYPGYPMVVEFGGVAKFSRVVSIRGDTLILKSGQGTYSVLDMSEGVVTYRDASGKAVETDLHSNEKALVLRPPNFA